MSYKHSAECVCSACYTFIHVLTGWRAPCYSPAHNTRARAHARKYDWTESRQNVFIFAHVTFTNMQASIVTHKGPRALDPLWIYCPMNPDSYLWLWWPWRLHYDYWMDPWTFLGRFPFSQVPTETNNNNDLYGTCLHSRWKLSHDCKSLKTFLLISDGIKFLAYRPTRVLHHHYMCWVTARLHYFCVVIKN